MRTSTTGTPDGRKFEESLAWARTSTRCFIVTVQLRRLHRLLRLSLGSGGDNPEASTSTPTPEQGVEPEAEDTDRVPETVNANEDEANADRAEPESPTNDATDLDIDNNALPDDEPSPPSASDHPAAADDPVIPDVPATRSTEAPSTTESDANCEVTGVDDTAQTTDEPRRSSRSRRAPTRYESDFNIPDFLWTAACTADTELPPPMTDDLEPPEWSECDADFQAFAATHGTDAAQEFIGRN